MMKRHLYRVGLWLAVLTATMFSYAASAQMQSGGIPVYVEDSPAAQDMGDGAMELIDQARYVEAAAVFQQLIDEYPLKIMRLDEGLYADGRRWAMARLAADEKLLSAYQRQMEPTAARLLAEATLVLPDHAPLEAVLSRYGMCASGLRAGLLLAGVWLERGAIDSAMSVLDELAWHPNLVDNQVAYHQLQSAAALLVGDAQRAETHRKALEDLNAQVAERELALLAERVEAPTDMRGYDSASVLPAARLPDSVSVSLWEQILATGAASQLPVAQQVPQQMIPGQSQLALPYVLGNELYVNDGWGIMRLDRNSGHVVWKHVRKIDNPALAAQQWQQWQRGQLMADQRGVAVVGDRLYAVVGRGMAQQMGQPGGDDAIALVCLDRATGSVIWERTATQIDPSLDQAMLHGTPIVVDGQIYLAARRMQMSGFEVSYALAVRAQDGGTVWKRYLASAAMVYRGMARALPPMGYHDGRLYVCGQLGAVTCLDAQRGTVVWMRVIPSNAGPADPNQRNMVFRGQTGASVVGPPLVTPAGLVVAQPGADRDPMLLDVRTGREIRNLAEQGWPEFDFVYLVNGDILGVGKTIEMFDGKTLKPRWRWALSSGQATVPQGRVAVTQDHVVVPTADRLVALELKSGKISRNMELISPGNVLVMQDQLIIVDGASVRSFMSWDRALAHLLEQAAQHPTDPRPALALAHLAERSNRPDQVLPAVDLAVEALQRRQSDQTPEQIAADEMRISSYEMILSFVCGDKLKDRVVLAALFNRLESIVAQPAEQAAYQIWLGAFLADSKEYAQAAERYQVVLQDANLSAQLFEHLGGTRLGGTEARLRLEALAEAAPDRSFYARFDALASESLNDLISQPVPSPDALVDLTRRYPLAVVGAEALTRAAELYVAADQPRAAVVQLRRAYGMTQDQTLLASIVGMLTQLHLDQHRVAQARLTLQRTKRAYPGLMPMRDGQAIAVDDWLSQLTHADAGSGKLPQLRLPLGDAIVQPGSLLVSGFQDASDVPRNGVMTRGPNSVQYRAGRELDVFWEAPVPGGDVDLVWMDDQLALLWVGGWQSFVAFELETGEPAWERVSAGEFLQVDRGGDNVGDEQRKRLAQMQAQMQAQQLAQRQVRMQVQIINGRAVQVQQFGPDGGAGQAGMYRYAANDSVVCISDHTGNLVGIDWRTGDVLWRSKVDAQAMTQIVMDQQHVAVLGVNGVQNNQMRGLVVVFDVLTGERLREIAEPNLISWIGLGGDEMVVFAGSGMIAAARIADHDVAWRMNVDRPMNRPTGEAGAEIAIVFDDQGMASIIEIATGQIVGRQLQVTGNQGRGGSAQILRADDQWHVLMPSQAVTLAGDGSLLWRDAIMNDGKFLMNQMIGQDFVAVLDYDIQAGPVPQFRQQAQIIHAGQGNQDYTLYLLDRAGGSILDARKLANLREPIVAQSALFLDNRLVLSTANAIIVIPGAKEAD